MANFYKQGYLKFSEQNQVQNKEPNKKCLVQNEWNIR